MCGSQYVKELSFHNQFTVRVSRHFLLLLELVKIFLSCRKIGLIFLQLFLSGCSTVDYDVQTQVLFFDSGHNDLILWNKNSHPKAAEKGQKELSIKHVIVYLAEDFIGAVFNKIQDGDTVFQLTFGVELRV